MFFSFHETSQPFSHYPSKILTLKIPVDILLTWQNNPHLICMDGANQSYSKKSTAFTSLLAQYSTDRGFVVT